MAQLREQTRAEIERGFYDVRLIEIEVEETPSMPIGMMAACDQRRSGADIGEMLGGILPKRRSQEARDRRRRAARSSRKRKLAN